MQAILYGDFWFNPRQCSVMQSGEVKHILQQSSAVKCIAVWSSPLQSSPSYSNQVSSMQVHCSVSPSGTTQVNISQLQQCSVVLSSPVPLTEVHCSVFQSGTQCRPQCIPAETSEVQPRAVRCHP